jgi:hypothetical protein
MATKFINELNFNKKGYDSFERNPAVIGYVNDVADYFANTPGPTGAQGVAGPTGPAGVPGPVGPAGLTWRSTFVPGTSYILNDAVGYNGASYYCILATSSVTVPSSNTTNWALLASQGAIGATGATGLQGPTGPQGPSGSSGASTQGSVIGGPNAAGAGILIYGFNAIASEAGASNYKLPDTPSIGQVVTVLNYASSIASPSATVRGFVGGAVLILNSNNSTTSAVSIRPNETSRFIYIGSGNWKVEYIASTNISFNNFLLDANAGYNIAETATNTTTSAFSADQLNLFYSATYYPVGAKVICRNIVGGGLMYIKVGATDWVSTPITAVV